jgi:putative ABC transport system permease protein
MKWTRLLRAALTSIRRNKTRSLLTALGIIIGVGSVIVMVGVGQGAQADIKAQIEALGTNVLMVRSGSMQFHGVSGGAGSSGRRLSPDDADAVAEQAQMVGAVSGIVNSRQQIVGGVGNWNTQVTGVSPEYLEIKEWPMASGQFFTQNDVRARAKVAVLGKTVADQLFPDSDPVGERIRIGAQPFTVIGVLSAKGQGGMGDDQDDVVLAPLTTVLYRVRGGRQNVDMIMMSAVSAGAVDSATAEVTRILRAEHKLTEGEDDDFTIRTQSEIIERASSTTRTMTLLLGAIAAVSLIVGGIGIMNIMLVSVTERTREIGIRMAVGARGSDILVQFLTESVVLSAAGGILGILTASALAVLMNTLLKVTTVISAPVVLVAFVFAAAVGVFFGFYPARKAARLNPIDALRYE